MNKEHLPFVLYPVKEIEISDKKLYQIFDTLESRFKDLSIEDLIEVLNIETTLEDIEEIGRGIKAQEKEKVFKLANEVLNMLDYSKSQLEKLAVLGKLLDIKSGDTGININIYEKEELNEFEFKKTVRNFSLVSAAIGFIPLPVSDYAIITVIHTGMVTKISSVYDYKLEPKEFLKMLGGVIGTGFVFRTLSQVLRKFVPFIGWFINAGIAYAGTYAVGILTKAYIAESGDLSKDAMVAIWERSVEEGKKEFNSLKEFVFEKKDELLKEFENYKSANPHLSAKDKEPKS
jgi:uncharacterized protein (DUF697 family)